LNWLKTKELKPNSQKFTTKVSKEIGTASNQMAILNPQQDLVAF